MQLWLYILQRSAARAESHQSSFLTDPLTSMKSLYGGFKGIFGEIFLALLLCISVFMLPQVDK